jgi:hypothetical protein
VGIGKQKGSHIQTTVGILEFHPNLKDWVG